MSRLSPGSEPAGYDPRLELSLRKQREGGKLADRVRPTPANSAARSLLVLVHGFNNHYVEAAVAYYDGFRVNQRKFVDDVEAFERGLGDVFWPGDANWWGLLDYADFLVYPAAVGTAQRAGPKLAEYLGALPNLVSVHFVAHSLGCRVVLEAVDALRVRYPRVRVDRVCLMAAAVPTFKLRGDGELVAAMAWPKRVKSLHSSADLVLKVAFRAGQSIAKGREGLLPKALGADEPQGIARTIEHQAISGASHGDYWGHNRTEAVEPIAEFFGFEQTRSAGVTRGVGEDRQTAPARATGQARRA